MYITQLLTNFWRPVSHNWNYKRGFRGHPLGCLQIQNYLFSWRLLLIFYQHFHNVKIFPPRTFLQVNSWSLKNNKQMYTEINPEIWGKFKTNKRTNNKKETSRTINKIILYCWRLTTVLLCYHHHHFPLNY